jgi:hypothetical protein
VAEVGDQPVAEVAREEDEREQRVPEVEQGPRGRSGTYARWFGCTAVLDHRRIMPRGSGAARAKLR